MRSLLNALLPSPFRPDTSREKELSTQVDRLELELAQARRETEAAHIRLDIERNTNAKHRLRDYPASTLANTISNQSLFGPHFHNPLDDLLIDVAQLGYDVSGPLQTQRAQLALIAQYQDGVSRVITEAAALKTNRALVNQ